jgi:hypothetical protein
MSNERIPNDPYRSGLSDDNFGRPQRFDDELQVDPELAEGPASSSKIVLFAVGIAIVLGAVFYGLNNTSVHEAQTAPPAQTAQTQAPANAQPTPPNTQPGMTTGSATSRPTPPQSAPQGTEVDKSDKQ